MLVNELKTASLQFLTGKKFYFVKFLQTVKVNECCAMPYIVIFVAMRYSKTAMFDKFLTLIFGSKNDRDIKALKPLIAQIEEK
ncbi:MAG TPA: hypothetical protein DCQ43_00395, partial [Treponema sp.]|nr:hypothetical protein [Treponema sp.]